MPLEFDVKYERSKKKIAKKIDLSTIEETEKLFQVDPSHRKLNLKNITCKRDKHKQSIRVLGSDGYRILLTRKDEIIYFQDIMNPENYGKTTHHSPTPAKLVISLHSSSEISLSSLN